jgi:hypothetical protein
MRAYPLAARRASGSRYERIRFPRSNHSYHLNLRDSGGYRPSQTAAHIRRLLARLPPDSEPRSAMSDFRPATTPAVRSRSGACRSWLGAGPAHPREPSACAPIGSPCSSQSWAAASTLQGRDELSPASISSLFFLSASMTSYLVRPLTLYRLRLPSGPKPLQRTPSRPGNASGTCCRCRARTRDRR